MKLFKKLSKKKKIIAIIIIILLIIIVRNGMKNNNQEEKKVETEIIEKRTISQTVAATGTVTTQTTKEITSALAGSTIKTVNVVEGQMVSEGDVICTFDMDSVKKNLADAKSNANISSAQANLGIESAQRNLNDATKNRDNQIVSAQKEVEATNQAYQNVQNQLNEVNAQIAVRQNELQSINASIAQLQSNSVTDTPVLNEAIPAPAVNIEDSNTQLSNYQNRIQELNTEIAQLQAQLPELNQQVNQLKGALDGVISALNATTTTVDSNIANMQDSLRNAELNASANSQAQKGQIRAYEEQLEKGIVTANVSGTVTSVNVKEGDIYSGSTIAKIDGTNEFIIEAEIDEYYIADIKEGMKVLIKTDSTRDEELTGKIIYTALSSTTNSLANSGITSGSSGNATYNVKIALDNQNERLRLGMNAKLSIIINSKEDVWSVPYDAVYEREDGSHYIEILKDNVKEDAQIKLEDKEELDVTVGIEGNYYIEIYSDKLKDGMKVVLPEKKASDSIEELINAMGADAGM